MTYEEYKARYGCETVRALKDGTKMVTQTKSHINERMHTGLAQSGRAAGMGISYDRYDDESGNPDYDPHDSRVRLPSDGLTEEKLAALSGAVRVTKGATNDHDNKTLDS